MSESDLERELNRRGQELLRKLLQGHLDQRSPGEAAGPVEEADGVEHSERRLHDRRLETTFGTVSVERLGYAHPGHDSLHPLDASPRKLQRPAVSAICRLIGRLIGRWGRLTRAWVQMGHRRRSSAQSVVAKLPEQPEQQGLANRLLSRADKSAYNDVLVLHSLSLSMTALLNAIISLSFSLTSASFSLPTCL